MWSTSADAVWCTLNFSLADLQGLHNTYCKLCILYLFRVLSIVNSSTTHKWTKEDREQLTEMLISCMQSHCYPWISASSQLRSKTLKMWKTSLFFQYQPHLLQWLLPPPFNLIYNVLLYWHTVNPNKNVIISHDSCSLRLRSFSITEQEKTHRAHSDGDVCHLYHLLHVKFAWALPLW